MWAVGSGDRGRLYVGPSTPFPTDGRGRILSNLTQQCHSRPEALQRNAGNKRLPT